MVERQGVIPPQQGRPPSHPPRGQVRRRRAVAAVLLLGCLAVAVWLGASALGSDDGEEAAPVTTAAVKPPTILRIVFPEFVDMGDEMISIASPLGRALIGARPGQRVSLATPGGNRAYVVLEVTTLHGETLSGEGS